MNANENVSPFHLYSPFQSILLADQFIVIGNGWWVQMLGLKVNKYGWFSPTWSCVSLPRPTTSSGRKFKSYNLEGKRLISVDQTQHTMGYVTQWLTLYVFSVIPRPIVFISRLTAAYCMTSCMGIWWRCSLLPVKKWWISRDDGWRQLTPGGGEWENLGNPSRLSSRLRRCVKHVGSASVPRCCFNVGPASQTLAQHWTDTGTALSSKRHSLSSHLNRHVRHSRKLLPDCIYTSNKPFSSSSSSSTLWVVLHKHDKPRFNTLLHSHQEREGRICF